jgi:hypothetical protein
VVLYGSAAAGEHIPKHSDYNVLVIVESLAADTLSAAAAVARAWHEAGNPAPLTLTVSEWRGSSDIFPMEYADILERHRVLYGEPPFDGIRVERGDLRLQLEHEAMGTLIRLRQGVLASGGDGARQLALVTASLSTIMVIFRALLRLHANRPSTDNVQLSEEAGRVAGFDPSPFARVVRHLRGETKLSASDMAAVLPAYLSGLQRLVSYLDQYQAHTR